MKSALQFYDILLKLNQFRLINLRLFHARTWELCFQMFESAREPGTSFSGTLKHYDMFVIV